MTRSRTRVMAQRTLVACIAALAIASVAYRILVFGKLEHTSLVFIGIPAVLALALTGIQPTTTLGTVNKTMAIALCLSGVAFGEGFICILMASPLFFLVGMMVGKLCGRRATDAHLDSLPSSWKYLGIIALVPLSLEGVIPGFALDREETVTVSRDIPAPAEVVQASLAAPMQFEQGLPLFFRLGFPTPGGTAGEGLEIGDRRAVEFVHTGHHPGTLVLEITKREPELVHFTAVSDDSYITHWLSWHSAEVRWEEIAPGQTRVTWSLRYARRLDPAFYFKPLERYGVSLAAGYLIETLATPRSPEFATPPGNVQPLQSEGSRHHGGH